MRERFNRGRYWERVHRGELSAIVIDQGQPQDSVAEQEPSGTVSQMFLIEMPTTMKLRGYIHTCGQTVVSVLRDFPIPSVSLKMESFIG